MIRSSHPPRSKAHRMLKHLGVLTVLVPGCMVQQVSAQGSRMAAPAAQHHFRTASGSRSSTAPAGHARALRAELSGTSAFGIAPFGLRARSSDPVEVDFREFSRPAMALAMDPFPLRIGFGDSSVPSDGIGFKDAGTFDWGSHPAGGLDAFNALRIRAAMQNEEIFFPLPSIFTRGLGGSANLRISSTLVSQATLSGMLRGDFCLPFGSSRMGLRFDYNDHVRLGAKMAGLSGHATAMFTDSSSLLRNGMTFSTSELFGVRSTALSTGGGLRRMTLAAEKSTVPSLSLTVSF